MIEMVELLSRLPILPFRNKVLLPGAIIRIPCIPPSSVKLVEQELWQREEKGLIGVLPMRDSEVTAVMLASEVCGVDLVGLGGGALRPSSSLDQGMLPLDLVVMLKACFLMLAIKVGKVLLARRYSQFDQVVIAQQLFDETHERDDVLRNSMIGGYAKCGGLESARELLDVMPERNVASWKSSNR